MGQEGGELPRVALIIVNKGIFPPLWKLEVVPESAYPRGALQAPLGDGESGTLGEECWSKFGVDSSKK